MIQDLKAIKNMLPTCGPAFPVAAPASAAAAGQGHAPLGAGRGGQGDGGGSWREHTSSSFLGHQAYAYTILHMITSSSN